MLRYFTDSVDLFCAMNKISRLKVTLFTPNIIYGRQLQLI